MIAKWEEEKLRWRLLESGAARLLPLNDAPVDAGTGEVITAVFFAVPHSAEWDRLIMDRRPLNHGEHRQQ